MMIDRPSTTPLPDEVSAPAAAAGEEASPGAAAAPQRRRWNTRRMENLAWQIGLLVAFLALWEYASDRWVPSLLVSRPSAIGQFIWRWLLDGTYAKNLWVTVQAMVLGFSIGASGGMVLGYLTGTWKRFGEIIQPAMTALYTMPRLALAPLFLLWFGLGMQFRVAFAAMVVFFLVYYNTYAGVREVSSELIAAVRIMGASRRQVALRVIIPSALVWVAAGLKISVPYALVGVVVGELLASGEGMGYLLARSANQFSAAGTFAAIVALMIIALIVDWAVTSVTKRALRWKTAGALDQQ